MINISMIGNLAADAQITSGNGKEWLTFRLADTRRWNDQQGNKHESTQWASCIMPATQGNLLNYLKKGVKVYVSGSSEIEIYSSPKLRKMVARYNISVLHVELCGGSSDAVPRQLAAPDGTLVDILKAFYISPSEQKEAQYTQLFSPAGGIFDVDANGFVWPSQQQEEQATEAANVGQAKENSNE